MAAARHMLHPLAQPVLPPTWPLWASGTFSYMHVAFIGSSFFEDVWLADARLSYDIWRNMTLTLEYQYSRLSLMSL